MERSAALRKLKKMIGRQAYWTIADGLSSQEKRDRYRARRTAIKSVLQQASDALKARREAILSADAEYQILLAAYKAASAESEDVRYRDGESGYKFEVGTFNGLFRKPMAYGDTWEEVFAKLEREKAVSRG